MNKILRVCFTACHLPTSSESCLAFIVPTALAPTATILSCIKIVKTELSKNTFYEQQQLVCSAMGLAPLLCTFYGLYATKLSTTSSLYIRYQLMKL